jgi:hypothetical protein
MPVNIHFAGLLFTICSAVLVLALGNTARPPEKIVGFLCGWAREH